MWTLLRNEDAYNEYVDLAVTKYTEVAKKECRWAAETPDHFPVLVTTELHLQKRKAPEKIIATYVYPEDAKTLSDAVQQELPVRVSVLEESLRRLDQFTDHMAANIRVLILMCIKLSETTESDYRSHVAACLAKIDQIKAEALSSGAVDSEDDE